MLEVYFNFILVIILILIIVIYLNKGNKFYVNISKKF